MLLDYEGQDLQELTKEGLTLVDFFATWCGPCKMIMPQLEALSEERTDVKFIKVDTGPHRDFAVSQKISSVPTLVLFKDGVEVDRRSGFAPKQDIEKWIDKHL